jgi:hypothetical protein
MVSQSQSDNFESVVNKLQFHVFTANPDSCVLPFLKRCVPVLAEEPKSIKGKWTMYSPESLLIPQDGLISINVAQHPSLHCTHSSSRFDVLTQEWQDGSIGIKALRVRFYFNSKAEAEMALKTIVNMFKAANTGTKEINQTEMHSVMLYENQDEDWVSAKLILKSEHEGGSRYSILFIYGSDNGQPW